MKTNERKPYGPRNNGGYATNRKITVDDKTVDVLRNYGSGNLSQGVRMAAALIAEWESYNGLPPPPPPVCHVL